MVILVIVVMVALNSGFLVLYNGIALCIFLLFGGFFHCSFFIDPIILGWSVPVRAFFGIFSLVVLRLFSLSLPQHVLTLFCDFFFLGNQMTDGGSVQFNGVLVVGFFLNARLHQLRHEFLQDRLDGSKFLGILNVSDCDLDLWWRRGGVAAAATTRRQLFVATFRRPTLSSLLLGRGFVLFPGVALPSWFPTRRGWCRCW
mmetsp:Transcript_19679/g.45773  ORF Transcript_19679/g.45773 Transcript_19679/m.45773 type:complete len:200 (-) Transcript_19679:310-909(-)